MAGATFARSGLTTLHAQPAADEVRSQMARVLASPLFKNSRHYPALLRYVVEETLEGRNGHLKERSLGVVVFGREPNYDTNLDPVVRTSACEVRKRLAQYYHEHEPDAAVRIEVPHGSYVPEFRYSEAAVSPAPVPVVFPVPAQPAKSRVQRVRNLWLRFRVPAIAIALALLGGFAYLRFNRSAIQQFWSPVWGSSDNVMISLGPFAARSHDDANAKTSPTIWDVMAGERVAFADAITMGRLTGLFLQNGRRFDIRKPADFSLNDFRNGPVVLIGAFNNEWTLRLENQLRFGFERDPASPSVSYIRDRQNPSHTNWRTDLTAEYSKVSADYALVSRVLDPRTERSVVVVAGLTKDGTKAAGEFVTEERYLKMLTAQAPSGWERKNIQVVISTEIIDGNPGPPHILASYFW